MVREEGAVVLLGAVEQLAMSPLMMPMPRQRAVLDGQMLFDVHSQYVPAVGMSTGWLAVRQRFPAAESFGSVAWTVEACRS